MHKINWHEPKDVSAVLTSLDLCPLHARALGDTLGLSEGQIYYRLRKCGVSLRAIRDGHYGIGAQALRHCFTMNDSKRVLQLQKLEQSKRKAKTHGKRRKK